VWFAVVRIEATRSLQPLFEALAACGTEHKGKAHKVLMAWQKHNVFSPAQLTDCLGKLQHKAPAATPNSSAEPPKATIPVPAAAPAALKASALSLAPAAGDHTTAVPPTTSGVPAFPMPALSAARAFAVPSLDAFKENDADAARAATAPAAVDAGVARPKSTTAPSVPVDTGAPLLNGEPPLPLDGGKAFEQGLHTIVLPVGATLVHPKVNAGRSRRKSKFDAPARQPQQPPVPAARSPSPGRMLARTDDLRAGFESAVASPPLVDSPERGMSGVAAREPVTFSLGRAETFSLGVLSGIGSKSNVAQIASRQPLPQQRSQAAKDAGRGDGKALWPPPPPPAADPANAVAPAAAFRAHSPTPARLDSNGAGEEATPATIPGLPGYSAEHAAKQAREESVSLNSPPPLPAMPSAQLPRLSLTGPASIEVKPPPSIGQVWTPPSSSGQNAQAVGPPPSTQPPLPAPLPPSRPMRPQALPPPIPTQPQLSAQFPRASAPEYLPARPSTPRMAPPRPPAPPTLLGSDPSFPPDHMRVLQHSMQFPYNGGPMHTEKPSAPALDPVAQAMTIARSRASGAWGPGARPPGAPPGLPPPPPPGFSGRPDGQVSFPAPQAAPAPVPAPLPLQQAALPRASGEGQVSPFAKFQGPHSTLGDRENGLMALPPPPQGGRPEKRQEETAQEERGAGRPERGREGKRRCSRWETEGEG
jgi:hypothetical protein